MSAEPKPQTELDVDVESAKKQREQLAKKPDDPLYVNRVKIYPQYISGLVRRFKWGVLIFLLSLYYIVPWLRYDRGPGHPDQAVLLDMAGRRAYFWSFEIWPQEIYYLTGLLVTCAIGLFLVTALFGRVWCGYTCPQTVWTDLFMWIEHLIEGDRNKRIKLDKTPMNAEKFFKKTLKHVVWMVIALLTGGAWIMYFTDAPTFVREALTGEASTAAYFMTGLFTFTTYLLAGWAREQVCVYMCPWPRFQGAMCDEHTFLVTYQEHRGEPRGKPVKAKPGAAAETIVKGDCVDCNRCVAVCPTGIDIRDGQQMECINCGLCIDACNEVMERLDRPKWLITWDTVTHQQAKSAGTFTGYKFFRPRTFIYIGVLTLILTVIGVTAANRSHLDVNVLRDRAPLFVTMSDGSIRNSYTLKILNKERETNHFRVEVQGVPDAEVTVNTTDGAHLDPSNLEVRPDDVGTLRLFIKADPAKLTETQHTVKLVLVNLRTGERATYTSNFISPAR